MATYTFTIEHFLSESEIRALADECMPSLRALGHRYVPEVDLGRGYPTQPEYLDVVRTSWLLDASEGRPPHVNLVKGLGFAFGMLLQQRTALRWCAAHDESGGFFTMGRMGDDPVCISVPVFAYVEKRETLRNAEVFVDFFRQMPAEILAN